MFSVDIPSLDADATRPHILIFSYNQACLSVKTNLYFPERLKEG